VAAAIFDSSCPLTALYGHPRPVWPHGAAEGLQQIIRQQAIAVVAALQAAGMQIVPSHDDVRAPRFSPLTVSAWWRAMIAAARGTARGTARGDRDYWQKAMADPRRREARQRAIAANLPDSILYPDHIMLAAGYTPDEIAEMTTAASQAWHEQVG
jgi:hypothetical protein